MGSFISTAIPIFLVVIFGAQMNPGRELDALIAEKVMGQVVNRDDETGDMWLSRQVDNEIRVRNLPAYSTDIAAAWEVRDKVNTWSFSKRLAFKDAIQRVVTERLKINAKRPVVIHNEEIVLQVQPVDICLAALKAMGYEEGK